MLLVRIWIYQTTDLLFAEGYCMQDSEQSLLHPNSARYAPVVCPVAPPFMCVYKFFPPKGQLMLSFPWGKHRGAWHQLCPSVTQDWWIREEKLVLGDILRLKVGSNCWAHRHVFLCCTWAQTSSSRLGKEAEGHGRLLAFSRLDSLPLSNPAMKNIALNGWELIT